MGGKRIDLDELEAWAERNGRYAPGVTLLAVVAEERLGHGLGRLTPEELRTLLTEVYPEELTVAGRDAAAVVLENVGDLIDFLVETGRMEATAAVRLYQELVRSGTWFVEAVEALAVKEVTPPWPPVRLPEEGELAALVAAAPLTGLLLALAEWTGDGREIGEGGELTEEGARAAGEAVGAGDAAELRRLWEVACDAGVVEIDAVLGLARAGAGAAGLRSGPGAVLDAWRQVVLELLFPGAAVHDGGTSVVCSLLMGLFERRAPVTVATVRMELEGSPPIGEVEAAAGELERAGLLVRSGAELWLSPLGAWAAVVFVAAIVSEDVPVLGAYAHVGAAELLYVMRGYAEAERREELAGWLAGRGEEAGAREIAEALAEVSPLARLIGLSVLIEDLGEAGRAALEMFRDDPFLGRLVTLTLAARGEPFESASSVEGSSWVLVDMVAAGLELSGDPFLSMENCEPAGIVRVVQSFGSGDHPWTEAVLEAMAESAAAPEVTRAAREELRRLRNVSRRPAGMPESPFDERRKGDDKNSSP
ncbi:hypothetical protein [Actinomadura kijaniata]|uniref:hypothetical protein n=1 Tax=Actinomadura kijaniata TaxID=46161 RepID=UPI0008362283|nr:hypothetical protein [Actinomadura kijaniata]